MTDSLLTSAAATKMPNHSPDPLAARPAGRALAGHVASDTLAAREGRRITMTDDLIARLVAALESNDDDAARQIARELIARGAKISVRSTPVMDSDHTQSDLPRDRCIATTQAHWLLVDDTQVAELVREGWSSYGDIDHPATPDGEWFTEPDECDCEPSEAWLAVIDEAGLSGQYDFSVPAAAEVEITDPPTDPGGEYCLWWTTAGADSGPMEEQRFATLEHALAARQLASHRLHRKHRGSLACEYGVAILDDGQWRELEEH